MMASFDFLKPKWKRSDPQARIAGLGKLEDQGILAGLAQSDPDEAVREAALQRLDEVRPKWQHSQAAVRKVGIDTLEDQNVLKELAESDPDESVRQVADKRLDFLRVRALGTQLRSEFSDTSEKALKELAAIGTAEAVAEALKGLDATIHTTWRGYTTRLKVILPKFGSSAVMPFCKALDVVSPVLCEYLAMALVQIATPAAVPYLVRLLESEQQDLYLARVYAAEALGGLKQEAKPAIPVLLKHLKVDYDDTRNLMAEAAKEALKSIGIDVAPQVFPLLGDPSRRLMAIEILCALDLRDTASFNTLMGVWRQLEDKNPFLLGYLVRIAPSQCKEVLAEALASGSRVITKEASVSVWVDATAGAALLALQESQAQLVQGLTHSIDNAVQRILSEIKVIASQNERTSYDMDRILSIGSFGHLARSVLSDLDGLRKAAHRIYSILITGAMACIDADPRPHIKHLCAVMNAADAGHRDMPEAQFLRSIGGSGIADAVGYMAAWAANSPANNAKETLDKIAAIMGAKIDPVLREMKAYCPRHIQDCLESIEGGKNSS